MTDHTQTKEGTPDPKFYPNDGHEDTYQTTFATIKIETVFDRMTAVEDKLAQWELMLHDTCLIAAGVFIGLLIAIFLH